MVNELDRRLRSLDRLEAPDLWSAAVARARAVEQPGASWWKSRPLAIAVAAALATLVAIGGVAWAIRWIPEAPTPPVVTTTLQTTTTILPTTTTTVTTTVTTTTTPPSTTTSAPPGPEALPMTWERVPDQAAFDGGNMLGVLPGGPGLVAFGGVETTPWPDLTYEAALWVSADGLTWERVAGAGLGVVAQGLDGPVALGFGPRGFLGDRFGGCSGGITEPTAATSADGLTWAAVPQDVEEFCPSDRISQTVSIEAVAAAGDGFVAVGWEMSTTQNAIVWVSDNGTAWTRVEDASLVAGDGDGNHLAMTGVTAGGPGLIAVGNTGVADCFDCRRPAVWVSEDGLSWQRLGENALDIAAVETSDNGFYRVVADPQTGALFALAPGWGFWASADGLQWHHVTAAAPGTPLGVAFTPGRLVAVGVGEGTSRVWASADGGASWGLVDHGNPGFADASEGGGTVMSAVTVFGSTFVAVGYEGGSAGMHAAVWIGTWDE